MVTKRYPHTAVLTFVSPGTFSTITGIWAEGTTNTIDIVCNIQPNRQGAKYIVSDTGDNIGYNYTIFCPLYPRFEDVHKGAKLNFFDKDHIIEQLFPYQHHAEILC